MQVDSVLFHSIRPEDNDEISHPIKIHRIVQNSYESAVNLDEKVLEIFGKTAEQA